MSAIASPVAVDRRFHHEDTKREGVEIEEFEIERADMPLTPRQKLCSYMGYKSPTSKLLLSSGLMQYVLTKCAKSNPHYMCGLT